MEQVLLVNYNDEVIGLEEKMAAHEKALLHRAFSVFLFDENKVLLQKRASSKYHCPGLWTNTCCSHPRVNETVLEAASRRLMDELGIQTSNLKEVDSFIYCFPFSNGLTEFEIDHVIVGEYQGSYILNPEEVDEIKWIDINELKQDIIQNPTKYTPWFITAFNIALKNK